MVLRVALDKRSGQSRGGLIGQVVVRPLPTVVIGVVGGFIVGMTSVGSGSLMIVSAALPLPGARRQPARRHGPHPGRPADVGCRAGRAGLRSRRVLRHDVDRHRQRSGRAGRLAHLVGAPDRYIRPVITFVIFASGLKYVGLGTTALGWTLGAVLLGAALYWVIYLRPRRAGVATGSLNPLTMARRRLAARGRVARRPSKPVTDLPPGTARALRGCGSRSSPAAR